MTEREEFDAWFQRRYSCSNFNSSWEATAAMGHAWNAWQAARRTVSGQEESASDAVEAAALRALDKAAQDGHSFNIESYCAGYVDRHYAAPIPATEQEKK
jgi:hypothetical protein